MVKFKITQEQMLSVKRLWHEMNSRQIIITELIRQDKSFPISESVIFQEYSDYRLRYQETVNSLIREVSDNKYNDTHRWEIMFDTLELVIYEEK